MGKLDIIIPHLNYFGWARGLKSLIRNTPEGVINRIFVIDQSDQHRLWDKLANPWVTMIHTRNLGFAKAMNTGLRLSDAPYVMCLNDDVQFLNARWWSGIEETFAAVDNALCVNPSSVCDPDGRGGKVIMDGFEFKEDFDDEEYARVRAAKGDGWIDGICMWGPVFDRAKLDQVKGNIPGKAWFDERFFPGGAEDYDLNRRAYLSGFRCLGTNLSVVWHHWYSSKHPTTGQTGPKHDGQTLYDKWQCTSDTFDLFGNSGLKDVPVNLLREDIVSDS